MASEGCAFSAKRTFCVITGASRGLGRSIALEFSRVFAANSVLVLTGRDNEKLQRVKDEIMSYSSTTKVHLFALDLSSLSFNGFEEVIKGAVETEAEFDASIMVHNAGTLTYGERSLYSDQLLDVDSVRSYFDINLTSCIALNSIFMKYVAEDKFRSRTFINISSVTAVHPFKTWSLYCSGKAARDMFFQTLALEFPSVRVLNYAPGPLKTDMGVQARTMTGDEELRKMLGDLYNDGKYLDSETSVKRLIEILEKDSFTSGSHIDFFDAV